MSEELKPCPFCGGTAMVSDESGAWYAHCKDCAAEGPWNPDYCAAKAASDWNRRTQPAEAEGVSALDELLALFPFKIDKQAFVVNGGTPLSADGDDEFLSFKKVDAALVEVRRLAEQGRAALSAVTAERDRLQRNLNFTEQWYAARFERLADLGKSVGCWDAMAAIIANGTADQYETPTYAQQLVRANHRADVAERERDQLRAEVEASKWIPLSEATPPDGVPVLRWPGWAAEISIDEWCADYRCFLMSIEGGERATHWKPLSAPDAALAAKEA